MYCTPCVLRQRSRSTRGTCEALSALPAQLTLCQGRQRRAPTPGQNCCVGERAPDKQWISVDELRVRWHACVASNVLLRVAMSAIRNDHVCEFAAYLSFKICSVVVVAFGSSWVLRAGGLHRPSPELLAGCPGDPRKRVPQGKGCGLWSVHGFT